MMNGERIERQFDVGPDACLLVSNIRGRIDVQPGQAGRIEIVAVKETDSGDSEQTQVHIGQDADGRVTARTEFPDNPTWFSWNKPCKVNYQVSVPQTCSLTLKGVSSQIKVSSVEGSAHIRSVSGKIEIETLTGDLDVRSISGSIKGTGVIGELCIDTVSGSVHLLESDLSHAHAKTVSGAIRLETPLQEGPYDFDSVSGRVILIVPVDSAFEAHLKSMSGRLKTTLPGSMNRKNGRRASLVVGEDGPQITLKSISGNLYIVTSENEVAKAETVKSEEKNEAGPKRMAVLNRIESGEIDVDQAIRELT